MHSLPRDAGAAALFPPGGSPYRLTQYSVIDTIRPQYIETMMTEGHPLPLDGGDAAYLADTTSQARVVRGYEATAQFEGVPGILRTGKPKTL